MKAIKALKSWKAWLIMAVSSGIGAEFSGIIDIIN